VDGMTFAFGNGSTARADAEAEIVAVRPSGSALHITQQRAREKAFLADRGYPVTPFAKAQSLDELAVGLGAFADGENVGIAGAHRRIDDDAAIDLDAGVLGELGVRPDADRHDDQVGGQPRAVREHDRLDLLLAQEHLGFGPGDDANAPRLDRPSQQMTGCRIELPLHQRRHQVQHGDIPAPLLEPDGPLATEQATRSARTVLWAGAAGLLASCAMLSHLNGAIFVGVGCLVLLARRRFPECAAFLVASVFALAPSEPGSVLSKGTWAWQA